MASKMVQLLTAAFLVCLLLRVQVYGRSIDHRTPFVDDEDYYEEDEDGGMLIDGDMRMTREQYKALYGLDDDEEFSGSGEEPTAVEELLLSDEEFVSLSEEEINSLEDIIYVDTDLGYDSLEAIITERRTSQSKDRNHLSESESQVTDMDTKPTKRRLTKRNASPSSRKTRRCLTNKDCTWTDGVIPYEFSPFIFNIFEIQLIEESMKAFMEFTCLSFRPRKPEDIHYLLFTSGKDCSSAIGMQGGRQNVTLAPWCRTKGVVTHEIGHAVGLIHEHNRPDRDQYVDIHFNNVDENQHKNFRKFAERIIDTFGVPYDYLSIMHYNSHAFSANTEPTIVAKDVKFQDIIGTAKELSFYDIKSISLLYGCADDCDKSIKCPKNGFLGRDCTCLCPGSTSTTPCNINEAESEPDTEPIAVEQGQRTISSETTTANPTNDCSSSTSKTTVKPSESTTTTSQKTTTYEQTTQRISTTTDVPTKPALPCKDSYPTRCPTWKWFGMCSKTIFAKRCQKSCNLC